MNTGTIRDRAIALASKANKDAALGELLNEAIIVGEKQKQTVHKTFYQMMRDGLLTDDLPRPGTEPGKTNNPDQYETVNPATGRNETGSFLRDFRDATDAGRAIIMAKTNISNDASLGDPEKQERVKKFASQLNTLGSVIRRVFLCYHQKADIASEFKSVGISLKTREVPDGKGGTHRILDDTTTAPWCLTDKSPKADGEPSPYSYLSTGEFLALNVARAKLNLAGAGGNEWAALKKSGRKGKTKKKGGAEAGTLASRITTTDSGIDTIMEVGHWLRTSADGGTGSKNGASQIMAKLADMPKGDDRKRAVLSIGDAVYGLDSFWPAFDKEYQVYKNEQNAINAAVDSKAA